MEPFACFHLETADTGITPKTYTHTDMHILYRRDAETCRVGRNGKNGRGKRKVVKETRQMAGKRRGEENLL